MSMKQRLKMSALRRVQRWCLRHDFLLSRPPGTFEISNYKLAALRDLGFDPRFVIDCGAAEGDWARWLKRLFPDCRVLCLEPRDECQPALEAVAREFDGVDLEPCLLGERSETVSFHVHGHQSSTLANASGRSFGQTIECQARTLDEIVAARGIGQVDMIKMDLQGGELAALRGAIRTLERAELLKIEVNFIELYQGTPLVADVMGFLAEHDFRCYDILGLWTRPLDGALAQGEFLFVRNGSRWTANPRWSHDATWS